MDKTKRLLSKFQNPFTGVPLFVDSLTNKTNNLRKKIKKKIALEICKNEKYYLESILIKPEILDLLIKYLLYVSNKHCEKTEIASDLFQICDDIQHNRLFLHQEYLTYFLKSVYEGNLRNKRDIVEAIRSILTIPDSLLLPQDFALSREMRSRATISYKDLEQERFLLQFQFTKHNTTLKFITHKCSQWPVQIENKLFTLYDKKRKKWGIWPSHRNSRHVPLDQSEEYKNDSNLNDCIVTIIETLLEIAKKGESVKIQDDRGFSVSPLRMNHNVQPNELINDTTVITNNGTSTIISPKGETNALATGREGASQLIVNIPIIVSIDSNVHSLSFVRANRIATEELNVKSPYQREFIEIITVSGSHARVWKFEKNGSISSIRLNINKEWKKFVRIILGYLTMPLEHLGVSAVPPQERGRNMISIYENDEGEESLVMVQCVQRIDGYNFFGHCRLLLSEELKYIRISRQRFSPEHLKIFAAFSKRELSISDLQEEEQESEGNATNNIQESHIPRIEYIEDVI